MPDLPLYLIGVKYSGNYILQHNTYFDEDFLPWCQVDHIVTKSKAIAEANYFMKAYGNSIYTPVAVYAWVHRNCYKLAEWTPGYQNLQVADNTAEYRKHIATNQPISVQYETVYDPVPFERKFWTMKRGITICY